MRFMNYFRVKGDSSAKSAKDRLHIIIAQQRATSSDSPDFLPLLRQEIIAVIAKHTHINLDDVKVELSCKDNNSVLELNVTLPEKVAAEVEA